MVTLILASGALNRPLQQACSVRSLLRVPSGNSPALLEVVRRELEFSNSVFVATSEPIPSWYSVVSPEVVWINVSGNSQNIGATALTALLSIKQTNSSKSKAIRVVFGDTLSSYSPLDSVAVGASSWTEDWTYAPLSFSDSPIDIRASGDHQGIVAGVFVFSNIDLLEVKLREAIEGFDPVFCSEPFFEAVKEYSSSAPVPLTPYFDSEWQDFGHVESYFDFRRRRISGRSINQFQEVSGGLFVRKVSERPDKLMAEAQWFERLPKGFNSFVPRVLLSEGGQEYSVQFIKSVTVAEKLLYGEFELVDWRWLTSQFDAWFSLAKHAQERLPDAHLASRDAAWLEEHFGRRLETSVQLLLEAGLRAELVDEISARYVACLREIKGYFKVQSVVHGDLILSNVLADEFRGLFKLIDPRGGFSAASCYGPAIYDWAKLAQSLFGRYEEILAGQYSLDLESSDVAFYGDASRDRNYDAIRSWFMQSCPFGSEAVRMAGVLMLSALEFHRESPSRVQAMALVGKGLMIQA